MFIYFLDHRIYSIPFSATEPKVFSLMLASALLLSHTSRNNLQVSGTIDSYQLFMNVSLQTNGITAVGKFYYIVAMLVFFHILLKIVKLGQVGIYTNYEL